MNPTAGGHGGMTGIGRMKRRHELVRRGFAICPGGTAGGMNGSRTALSPSDDRTSLLSSHRPPAITDAEPAYADQHRARVRKYLLLMSLRIPALFIAWAVYAATGAALVGAVVIAVSAPLSWMAVLIANDRPPRPRRTRRRRGVRARRPGTAASAVPRGSGAPVVPAVGSETAQLIYSTRPAGDQESQVVRRRHR